MKKLLAFTLIGIMSLSLAACSKGEQNSDGVTSATAKQSSITQVSQEETTKQAKSFIEITHELGKVEVPYDAKKIVVLDLAVLDIIDALGLGDRVVGIPKKSSVSYLTAYNENDAIENLGSVKEVDMEALNALEPDLIFIGGRLSNEFENMNKIAPTVLVEVNHEAGYMTSFSDNVKTIASIFGLEEKAEDLLSDFDGRIEALSTAAEGKTAIVGLVTSSSLNTLGNSSRGSLITNEVGFTNAAQDVDSTHGDASSFELLLDKNPDYIFVLDRDTAINAEGAKVAKEVMENEIVVKTDAYKNGNIVYLTPDVWYLSEGGITATDTMIKDLESAILNK